MSDIIENLENFLDKDTPNHITIRNLKYDELVYKWSENERDNEKVDCLTQSILKTGTIEVCNDETGVCVANYAKVTLNICNGKRGFYFPSHTSIEGEHPQNILGKIYDNPYYMKSLKPPSGNINDNKRIFYDLVKRTDFYRPDNLFRNGNQDKL